MKSTRALGLALLFLCASPAVGAAQVFLASRPAEGLTVGPLFVVGRINEKLGGPVTVDVFFSIVVPPGRSDVEQDFYLLWPGAVAGERRGADKALRAFADARHFKIVDEGVLKLSARNFYRFDGERPPETIPSGAPYVTYLREGGALGSTSPATYIRIPWTPRLVNRVWLMDLTFTAPGVVQKKRATWIEEAFWGRRYLASLAFHDLRSRALFPAYYEQRDRVLKLADDPSQVILTFSNSDHLKIDLMSPPTATRRPSESRANTEMVSLYLDPSQGLAPQVLTVQFGYFSGVQAWSVILLPTAFFLLGNLAGPLLRSAAKWLSTTVAARIQVRRPTGAPMGKETGVVLERDALSHIVPGETTYDQILARCGPDAEEHEQIGADHHRTLIYRGRRVVPQQRRSFGWLATVSHWDVENHEVEIAFDGDRVSDVHARVRRSRLATPDN